MSDYSQQHAMILALIDTFLLIYPDEEWGAGHIALSDGNLDDDFIDSCLHKTDLPMLDETRYFLEALKQFPEEWRDWDASEEWIEDSQVRFVSRAERVIAMLSVIAEKLR